MGGETAWSIRLFGEIRVVYNGTDTPVFSNRKVAQLLLLLASQPSKTLSRDSIAETLWPGEYLEIAKDRLRQTLSLLNKYFRDAGGEPPIEANRTTIRLDSSQCSVDLASAQKAIEAIESHEDSVRLLQRISQAAKEPLADGFVDDWIKELRDSFTTSFVRACRRTAEQAADPASALLAADAGLQVSPLDEPLAIQRTTALYRLDKESEAALFAQSFKQRLQSQLGLAPSSAWLTAKQSVQGETETDEPPSTESAWMGVAQSVDRFFGRSAELDTLTENFAGTSPTRLLTITGQGGSGKTRLIVEFLSGQAPSFTRKVVLGLAERDSVSQIEADLAEALDIVLPSSGDLGKNLAAFLTDGQTLFVLDNCEHLMPEIATMVKSLLHFCPNVSILATSRIKLGIHGEREMILEPLKLPEENDQIENSPAVQLLIDRITSIDHLYEPDAEELAELGRLSRLLEGVPLALELAASQMAVLSARELRERLEGRIVELANANKDLPARHLALRNTLSWGYEQLASDRQRALSQLSLLHGPWTIEEAEAILASEDTVAIHEDLKKVAMIAIQAGSRPRRFRMLDMVRQFAGPFLTEEESSEVLLRHFRHFAAKVGAVHKRRSEADQTPIMQSFRNDLHHYRLLLHTGQQRLDLGAEMTQFIRHSNTFAEACGHSLEWMQTTKHLVDRGGLSRQDEGFLWAQYTHGQAFHGDGSAVDECVSKLHEFILNEEDFLLRRYMANQISGIIGCDGRLDLAEKFLPLLEECNECDLIDDQRAMGYHAVGNLYLTLRQIDKAEALFWKGLPIAQELVRPRSILWHWYHLSFVDFLREDHAPALDKLGGVFDILRRSGDHTVMLAYFRSIATFLSCLDTVGRWSTECTMILGCSEMRRRQHALRLDFDDKLLLNRAIENLRPRLGDRYDVLFNEGTKLTFDEAFDRCEAIFQSIS